MYYKFPLEIANNKSLFPFFRAKISNEILISEIVNLENWSKLREASSVSLSFRKICKLINVKQWRNCWKRIDLADLRRYFAYLKEWVSCYENCVHHASSIYVSAALPQEGRYARVYVNLVRDVRNRALNKCWIQVLEFSRARTRSMCASSLPPKSQNYPRSDLK